MSTYVVKEGKVGKKRESDEGAADGPAPSCQKLEDLMARRGASVTPALSCQKLEDLMAPRGASLTPALSKKKLEDPMCK